MVIPVYKVINTMHKDDTQSLVMQHTTIWTCKVMLSL